METNYSETFIDIIVSVNERKATLDFRSYLLHTANIPCLICLPEIRDQFSGPIFSLINYSKYITK